MRLHDTPTALAHHSQDLNKNSSSTEISLAHLPRLFGFKEIVLKRKQFKRPPPRCLTQNQGQRLNLSTGTSLLSFAPHPLCGSSHQKWVLPMHLLVLTFTAFLRSPNWLRGQPQRSRGWSSSVLHADNLSQGSTKMLVTFLPKIHDSFLGSRAPRA